MSESLSVVVPNYNGSMLLRRYLPSVLASLEAAGGGEVVVVDDASTDDSLDVLQSEFPGVPVLSLKENSGFGNAVNAGAAEVGAEYMAVCMTDIEVERAALANALAGFTGRDVFAVALTLVESPGAGNGGVTCLPFSRGFFHTAFPDAESPGSYSESPFHVAFATGGAMLVRREQFQSLGGFDPDYAPFNWEDVDLSWRAWQNGWRVISHPSAVAWHRHPHVTVSSTSSRQKVERILWRNRMLFIHKNISDRWTLSRHHVWLAGIMFKAAVRGRPTVVHAWKEARACLRRRPPSRGASAVGERELMAYLAKPRALECLPPRRRGS